jgi:hypothetical protein
MGWTRFQPSIQKVEGTICYTGGMVKDHFVNIPSNFKCHYLLILTKEHSHSTTNRHRALHSPISNRDNLQFLEFLKVTIGDSGWMISISGSKMMNLWTETDDWEIIMRLQSCFDDHRTGISLKTTR